MNKAIAKLTRTIEEKDMQIATLMNKLELQHDKEVDPDPKKNQHDQEASENESFRDDKASSIGSIFIQQFQDMMANIIGAQYGGASCDTLIYSKPYTKRIDSLWMPICYQPPKSMQFDEKKNLKQFVGHFDETCNNVGMEGDYHMKHVFVPWRAMHSTGTKT